MGPDHMGGPWIPLKGNEIMRLENLNTELAESLEKTAETTIDISNEPEVDVNDYIIYLPPSKMDVERNADGFFVCPEPGCDYKSSHTGHVERHFRKHTGERPFQCKFCDKKFTEKSGCIKVRFKVLSKIFFSNFSHIGTNCKSPFSQLRGRVSQNVPMYIISANKL